MLLFMTSHDTLDRAGRNLHILTRSGNASHDALFSAFMTTANNLHIHLRRTTHRLQLSRSSPYGSGIRQHNYRTRIFAF